MTKNVRRFSGATPSSAPLSRVGLRTARRNAQVAHGHSASSTELALNLMARSGSPEAVRANLREAIRLLREAGYELRNQKLVDAKSGEPYAVEFLASDPNTERFVLFYKSSLERLGMTVTVRTVDDDQSRARARAWPYWVGVSAHFSHC